MKYWVYANDGMIDALVGPFETKDLATAHIKFCADRGDAYSELSVPLTDNDKDNLLADDPDIMVMTPEEDRAFDVEAETNAAYDKLAGGWNG